MSCQVENQQGPSPEVMFRYNLSPLASCKTFIFKPNALEQTDSIRAVSVGALYAGNYDKVVRNKIASLVWEALPSRFINYLHLSCSPLSLTSQRFELFNATCQD